MRSGGNRNLVILNRMIKARFSRFVCPVAPYVSYFSFTSYQGSVCPFLHDAQRKTDLRRCDNNGRKSVFRCASEASASRRKSVFRCPKCSLRSHFGQLSNIRNFCRTFCIIGIHNTKSTTKPYSFFRFKLSNGLLIFSSVRLLTCV